MRAGLPITMAFGGTSAVTTDPAATMALRPTRTPGRIVALAPMLAPRSITVCFSGLEWSPLLGNRSFVNVALGPTKTSSRSRTPFHNCTPDLTVTRSPTWTSDSMKT
jgi:hypothetical protein